MSKHPMTRQDMQTDALTVEKLLDAAMALLGSDDTDGTFTMIEMAQAKASKLNSALDSVNAPEGAV